MPRPLHQKRPCSYSDPRNPSYRCKAFCIEGYDKCHAHAPQAVKDHCVSHKRYGYGREYRRKVQELNSLPPDPQKPTARDLRDARMMVYKQSGSVRKYYDDRVGFVFDCFDWSRIRHGAGSPRPYQVELLSQLDQGGPICRQSVRGPHGLGKSSLLAWIVLHFALTRDQDDWKCITTAGSWRQLIKYLWPEIHRWARIIRWDKVGRPVFSARELTSQSLKLKTGEAFAAASDQPDLLEGAHADCLLYIFDESKSVGDETFDAAEGAFSGAGLDTGLEAITLAYSTPGAPSGRFYQLHSKAPGFDDWRTRHVTLQECIDCGAISREWIQKRREQWGEKSAVYQNRVLGEFAADEEDSLIPLAWIEAANERWRDLEESGQWGDFVSCGVDVAGGGEAKSVIAERYANAVRALRYFSKGDTMELVGEAIGIMRRNAHQGGTIVVDATQIGKGPLDRFRELGRPVIPFVSQASSGRLDRAGELGFRNKRSEGWWNLREILDPVYGDNLALPPDDLLTGDLKAPHYRVMSGGKIEIEGKDTIEKRIHRSTDAGDAVMMAFCQDVDASDAWTPVHGDFAALPSLPSLPSVANATLPSAAGYRQLPGGLNLNRRNLLGK